MIDKPKPMSKAQLRQTIAEGVGISGKQVEEVLDLLSATIIDQVNSTGSFVLPGVLKVSKVEKPARPARKMYSQILKKEIDVEAKPASNSVRIRPLKGLKDAIV